MAAGGADFCKDYVAADDINNKIATDSADFFRRYRLWEAAGAPAASADMFLYFGGWETIWEALDAGDSSQGRTAGNVPKEQCALFNAFVAWGQSGLQELGIQAGDADEALRLVFMAALRNLFTGTPVDQLTSVERAILNGAIIAKVDIVPTAIGSGSAVQRLYAVPGHVVFDGNIKDEAFAADVDQVMEQAFTAVGTRLINLNGVVQLRLSAEGEEAQEPVVVAPGLTIMGGA